MSVVCRFIHVCRTRIHCTHRALEYLLKYSGTYCYSRMARTFTTLLFVLSCRWQEIVNDRHKSDGNAATWTSEPSRWPVEQSAHKFKYSSRGRITTWRRWGQPLKASDVVWICAWSRISSSLLYPLILLLLLLSSSHTALYLSIFFLYRQISLVFLHSTFQTFLFS